MFSCEYCEIFKSAYFEEHGGTVGLASLTFFSFSSFQWNKILFVFQYFCSTVHCTLTRLSGQGYYSPSKKLIYFEQGLLALKYILRILYQMQYMFKQFQDCLFCSFFQHHNFLLLNLPPTSQNHLIHPALQVCFHNHILSDFI